MGDVQRYEFLEESTDDGLTWHARQPAPDLPGVRSVLADHPAGYQYVCGGMKQGTRYRLPVPVTEDEPEPAAAERVTIERSMDEGETWETIESSLSSPAALALAGIEPGVAWCSPSRSWYRWPLPERAAEEEVTPVEISTDDGVTWKPMGWCGPLIISRLKGMGPGEVIVGKFSGNHYRFPVSAGVPPQAAPEEEKPELTQEAADPMAPFNYLVKARQVPSTPLDLGLERDTDLDKTNNVEFFAEQFMTAAGIEEYPPISAFVVKPGETLVVTLPQGLPEETVRSIYRDMEDTAKRGEFHCIVFAGEVKVSK